MSIDNHDLQKILTKGIHCLNSNNFIKAEKYFNILRNNITTKKIGLTYLGIIEIKKNNHSSAIKIFNEVLIIDKDNYEANLNLGLIYLNLKKFLKSETFLKKASIINPKNNIINYHLGLIKLILDEYDAAKQIFSKILDEEPLNINVRNNLGLCMLKQSRINEAIKIFQKCLEQNNSYLSALYNLGVCYSELKDFKKSIIYYSKVLNIDPDHIGTKLGLSKCYFAIKDYKKGFELYESRKKLLIKNEFYQKFNEHNVKVWNGELLENKVILILSEQGIGDNIQFIRYVFWLKEKYNVKIFFYTKKNLQHLFKNCPVQIITEIEDLKKFDYFQHLMTLPYLHFLIENCFYKNIPYISSNIETDNKWRQKLKNKKKPIIAIHWQGNKNYINDNFRSIPLLFFKEIINNKKYSFISLQKGEASNDISKINVNHLIDDFSQIIDLEDKSFLDTISILNNIDLLITSDTSIAHLAGTMNINSFLLLNYNPDWRWYVEIYEKCFYKSLKIFQQEKFDDWYSVFKLIKEKI